MIEDVGEESMPERTWAPFEQNQLPAESGEKGLELY